MPANVGVVRQRCSFSKVAFPDKLERIDLLFSALDNSYDIITFQEVFRFGNTTLWHHDNSPHDKMIEKSKEHGYFNIVESIPPKSLRQDSGLLTVSKHKILEHRNIIFNTGSWTDYYLVSKGYLYAKIKKDDKTIHVFTCHLDAHDKHARASQVKQLVNAVQSIWNDDDLFIITGDFNIASGTKEYTHLVEIIGPQFKNVYGEDVNKYPVTQECKSICIDHVFVNKNLETSFKVVKIQDAKRQASDHYGVDVNIKF